MEHNHEFEGGHEHRHDRRWPFCGGPGHRRASAFQPGRSECDAAAGGAWDQAVDGDAEEGDWLIGDWLIYITQVMVETPRKTP